MGSKHTCWLYYFVYTYCRCSTEYMKIHKWFERERKKRSIQWMISEGVILRLDQVNSYGRKIWFCGYFSSIRNKIIFEEKCFSSSLVQYSINWVQSWDNSSIRAVMICIWSKSTGNYGKTTYDFYGFFWIETRSNKIKEISLQIIERGMKWRINAWTTFSMV